MKRRIDLLTRNKTHTQIEEMKSYCIENDFCFKEKTHKSIDNNMYELYYFSIFSDTNGFEKFYDKFHQGLSLTNYSELFNIIDLDDEFSNQFFSLKEDINVMNDITRETNAMFIEFIMNITKVDFLKALYKYMPEMNNHQESCLKDRIDVLNGKNEDIQEELIEGIFRVGNDVKFLRESIVPKMNRKEFAKYFEIPYRTVEDWENNKATCSTYLFKLMVEKLKANGYIN